MLRLLALFIVSVLCIAAQAQKDKCGKIATQALKLTQKGVCATALKQGKDAEKSGKVDDCPDKKQVNKCAPILKRTIQRLTKFCDPQSIIVQTGIKQINSEISNVKVCKKSANAIIKKAGVKKIAKKYKIKL